MQLPLFANVCGVFVPATKAKELAEKLQVCDQSSPQNSVTLATCSLVVRNWSSSSSLTLKRWRTTEKLFRSQASWRSSVSPEILSLGRWRKLANPAELPVEVGKVRQSNLIRDDVYRQPRLAEAHTCTSDAKLT
jgi:hypothetical protein